MGIFDQIKDAAAGHEAQVDQGVEKLGDLVDERTGGTYAAHVDQAQDFVRGQLTDSEAQVEASTEQALPDTLDEAARQQV